jgi:hypothetical protein
MHSSSIELQYYIQPYKLNTRCVLDTIYMSALPIDLRDLDHIPLGQILSLGMTDRKQLNEGFTDELQTTNQDVICTRISKLKSLHPFINVPGITVFHSGVASRV